MRVNGHGCQVILCDTRLIFTRLSRRISWLPDPSGWRELASEWVRRADDDLTLVRLAVRQSAIGDGAFGFHAQQAIEKALKAALAAKGEEPRRTHNLRYLADQVRRKYRLQEDPLYGADLTAWATVYRYPGTRPPGEPLRREEVLSQVEACVALVRSVVPVNPRLSRSS